ncbi:hypothetical protein CQ018_17320 [Arthrobacter sp. MYb227]|uniref:hypothetical protein n=1 Tax=Arthrobacter sp. MYb227 TaxID=1848601 RepID=UPI000CFDBCB2|nr:hypothetical protein [Arthrobacter sp. MYb227]PQZ87711.1 hypothetical protein CQ018_17320 [Arthrobacter sp. MYb227]
MSEIEKQGIMSSTQNRRTIVKGAAWSVPVIAAAIAAPMAAASGETGTLVVSTNNCSGLEIASNPEFVITASGGDTATTTFNITSSKVVNLTLQNAWTGVGGISLIVLSGNTWSFTIPALTAGQSVTLKSNAQLVSLLGSYTGAVANGDSKTMSLTLGLLGLVTLCSTN